MIRRKTRRLSLLTDEDGCLVDFNMPHEALLYDLDQGRQCVKDRIDDRREELAMMADRPDSLQIIFDAADRTAIARKIKAGKSVV